MGASGIKIEHKTFWTIVCTAAISAGTGAALAKLHDDDSGQIAYLHRRVESLEGQLRNAQKVSDGLRKELNDELEGRKDSGGSCPRRTDNADIKNELIHLEAENETLKRQLDNLGSPDIYSEAGVVNRISPESDPMVSRLSDEYQRNLSDISELRRKLVCLP